MASILMVVGDAAAPTTADSTMKSHVEGLGHTVTLISDETAEPGDVNTAYGMVFIFESVSGATLSDKYKSVTIGLLGGEHTMWGAEYFTSDGGLTDTSVTDYYISDYTDLLFAGSGLSSNGDAAFLSAAGTASMSYALATGIGTPSGAPADRQSDHSYTAIWRYEVGDPWHPSFGNAVGRRVVYDISDESVAEGNLTTLAWKVYDNAIAWLLNETTSPVWTTPADTVGMSLTPELKFTSPASASKQHFWLELDTAATFDTGNLRTVRTDLAQTDWDYWNGSTWTAFPSDGLPIAYAGNEVRYTVTSALSTATWYRRVRAGALA